MTINPHLPPPIWDRYAWQQSGACRPEDTNLFFAESERGHTREIRVAAAKALCATCPVIRPCRDHGINAQEPYGIWGGLTAQERKTKEHWTDPERQQHPEHGDYPGHGHP